jgi:predicted NAD/FAD-dependent oxidoreductase
MIDVIVIGAGVAGLTCAQQLQQRGYNVLVVEKSRGLGGRLATRRLAQIHADHGVRCLEEQGELTRSLIQTLEALGLLHVWTERIYALTPAGNLVPSEDDHPRYAARDGLTSVAKFLGQSLAICRHQRVTAITPLPDRTWQLSLDSNLSASPALPPAKVVVVTIPAPQALALLAPLATQELPPDFIAALRSVMFAPCMTTIATFATADTDNTNWLYPAIECSEDAELAWIAIDSRKQRQPQQTTVILQSTAAFAHTHLESLDLRSVGQQMLGRAAEILSWQAVSTDLQIHRWRYAFVTHPYSQPLLHTDAPLPLICGGDWCGGANLEAALRSGMSCAAQAVHYLETSSPNATSSAKESATINTSQLFANMLTTIDRSLTS